MSVKATLTTNVTAVETLTGALLSAADTDVTHQLSTTKSLTASSTPPATKVASFNKALSSGTGTIDLTALPSVNGSDVDGTGLKVQMIKIAAKAANANAITITAGVSTGYDLMGASWSVVLSPGQEIVLYGNDATPDVGSGAKTIGLVGTGSQSVDVIVVLG